MFKKEVRSKLRKRRHRRVRKKLFGTAERPRLCVFKSLKHIYAQIVDDEEGRTLVSAATVELTIKKEVDSKKNMEAAKIVGKYIATRAKEKGVREVVFDRSGYPYHGKVKVLADSAREHELQF